MTEEMFDLLDENGSSLNQTKFRSWVHRDGDWHRTVHIWVLKDRREILLQLRGPNQESNPNKWDVSSAGHCQAGDDSLSAAVREVEEELGWSIEKQGLQFLGTLKSEWSAGAIVDREFSDIYLLEVASPVPEFKLQPEEVQAVQWISLLELQQRVECKDPQLVEHCEEFGLLLMALKNLCSENCSKG